MGGKRHQDDNMTHRPIQGVVCSECVSHNETKDTYDDESPLERGYSYKSRFEEDIMESYLTEPGGMSMERSSEILDQWDHHDHLKKVMTDERPQ